jgi:hypothetical protein
VCEKRTRKYSEKELQNIMLRLMREEGISTSEVNVTSDGVIEAGNISGLSLHSMMLQAEALGLAIKYTKKTLVEIC